MAYEVICKVLVWLAEKDGDFVSNFDQRANVLGVPGLYASASDAAFAGKPVRAMLTIEQRISGDAPAKGGAA